MSIQTLGIDLGKQYLHLNGVNEHGRPVLRKKLTQSKLEQLVEEPLVGKNHGFDSAVGEDVASFLYNAYRIALFCERKEALLSALPENEKANAQEHIKRYHAAAQLAIALELAGISASLREGTSAPSFGAEAGTKATSRSNEDLHLAP